MITLKYINKKLLSSYISFISILFYIIYFSQDIGSNSRIVYLLFGIFGLIGYFLLHYRKINIQFNKIILVFSIIFSIIIFSCNYYLYLEYSIIQKIILYPLIIFSCIETFYYIILFSNYLIPNTKIKINNYKVKKIFLIYFLVLFGFYLFIFITCLIPGGICTDSLNQIYQIRGVEPYSNHHPIYQTWLIEIFYDIGLSIFHNEIAAISTYTIFQILIISLCYAYGIVTLYQLGAKKKTLIICLLFYLITPPHLTFSNTIWKNSIYCAIIVVFICTLIKLYYKIGNVKLNYILLIITALVFNLLLTNGFIAFIFFFIGYLILCKKDFNIIKIFILSILISIICKYGILNILEINQHSTVEPLSVPIQQISRIIYEDESISQEQEDFINNIIPIELIKESYIPTLYDNVRNAILDYGNQEYISQHKIQFFKNWLTMVIQHPVLSIRAYIDVMQGYINPVEDYWYIWQDGVAEDDNLYQIILCESINKIYRNYIEFWQSNIILKQIYNHGLYLWILLIFVCICLIRKNINYKFILPIVGLWLTVILASLIRAEFRYLYFITTTFPILIFIMTKNDHNYINKKLI